MKCTHNLNGPVRGIANKTNKRRPHWRFVRRCISSIFYLSESFRTCKYTMHSFAWEYVHTFVIAGRWGGGQCCGGALICIKLWNVTVYADENGLAAPGSYLTTAIVASDRHEERKRPVLSCGDSFLQSNIAFLGAFLFPIKPENPYFHRRWWHFLFYFGMWRILFPFFV